MTSNPTQPNMTDATYVPVESPSSPSCRICWEGSESSEKLIRPCKCFSLVHSSCLETWRITDPVHPRRNRCEVCHAPYVLDKTLCVRCHHTSCFICALFIGLVGITLVLTVSGCLLGSAMCATGMRPCHTVKNYIHNCIIGVVITHCFLGLSILHDIGRDIDRPNKRYPPPWSRPPLIIVMFLLTPILPYIGCVHKQYSEFSTYIARDLGPLPETQDQ